MKYLEKHSKYIQLKSDIRKRNMMFRFMLIIALLFGSLATYGAVSDPDNAAKNICTTIGTGSVAMGGMVSIADVPDSQVSGSAIGYKVWLIPVSDVDDTVPFPTVDTNREVTTIPMKSGRYMHYFESHTVPTFLGNGSKDSGAVVITGTNTFTLLMGGNRAELLNFIENYAGTKFIILYQECESGIIQGIGNPCKPVIMGTYENKNDADYRGVTFTFTQSTIQQPWTYVGSIVRQDPVTVAAGSASLALVSGNDQYIISDGTAATYAINAVTGLTAADRGRVITLIGDGGGNAATVADGLPFILVDGATWTASKGSRLSLKVFDANTLTEVKRV